MTTKPKPPSAAAMNRAVRAQEQYEQGRDELLAKRDAAVVKALAAGWKQQAVADRLGLSFQGVYKITARQRAKS